MGTFFCSVEVQMEWNGVELYLVTLALLKMRAFLVRKKV